MRVTCHDRFCQQINENKMSSHKVSGGVVHQRPRPTTVLGSQTTSSKVSPCPSPTAGFVGSAAALQICMHKACKLHACCGMGLVQAMPVCFCPNPTAGFVGNAAVLQICMQKVYKMHACCGMGLVAGNACVFLAQPHLCT